MASGRFDCPHCDVVASRRHNFVQHLTATHGLDRADADQRAAALVPVPEPATPHTGRRFVTTGHLRSVSILEEPDAVLDTLATFRQALGGVDVFLRPIDAGLTVMSLDVERCASMVSVGAAGGGGALTSLPPTPDRVASMVAAYEDKVDHLARGSSEELFSLGVIARSVGDQLRIQDTAWWFVAHEWRLHLSNGSNGKIDLLAFDPAASRLVVIECKASAADARKPDRNGWDAARQADEYADAIWRGRDELYPFFDRLIAAQAAVYAPDLTVPSIDRSLMPTTTVWWPNPAGDHTPSFPAWNSAELAIKGDSPRLARYRLHQSWWRESKRGVRPGRHPKVPIRLIGSTFDCAAVAADRRLNFIDEAAYRHAERRAREVEVEGGTLDEDRLFSNLLSSMPMCFNLFGALATATKLVDVVRAVFDPEATAIDGVTCEAPSPAAWTDRTAFDAQIDYTVRTGDRRFVAVETKYTEPFTRTRYDRAEYRQLTEQCGWFEAGAAETLVEIETNQLWRGLLLMSVIEEHRFAEGRYCVVSPADDVDAQATVDTVQSWLVPLHRGRLSFVSLEVIIAAARAASDRRLSSWADDFEMRYVPS